MELWTLLVNGLRIALFALTHLYGGAVGWAILTLSLLTRLALMPLTLRIARRAIEAQRALQKLEPQLAKLRKKHANDPAELFRQQRVLMQQHGVRLTTFGGFLAGLVQMPVLGAVYSAIRGVLGSSFLWISSLAKPDLLLAAFVSVLAGLATVAGPRTGVPGKLAGAVAISTLITFFMISRFAAGIALYWGASNLISITQGLLLRTGDRPRDRD
jgi:YidC/Oxa1 family membrane protein insertase